MTEHHARTSNGPSDNESSDQIRTIVITGGTSGIGFAAAEAILRSDGGPWHVVVANRHPGRAQAAVARLAAAAAPGHTIEAMLVDLASLASVKASAAELTARLDSGRLPALHALVCNAGVQAGTALTTTADGFESTFGVNHLAHFLLVHELLPTLRTPARVIVVASDTHDPAKKTGVPAPAWNGTRELARGQLGPLGAGDNALIAGQRRYSTSKLANIYFTYALAARLPAGVTANTFNPGLVPGTGLQRSAPAPIRFLARHVLPHATWLLRRMVTPNVHSAAESGAALARLAIDPDLAGTTGQYFDGREPIPSSAESYDLTRADELWRTSLELTTDLR
ncbi:SDR family NAD(P)-dependent oxidoreductase [Micromonospora sp. Llam7]|uniref:SDR family NAD(P)-dependent oxidoreductase n=1 Tax=Micromonospora tarapacensis TaxID=2835305 RepID=UPI001C82A87F|nr:SDR family NAD(P)-dependent oxidoreductase [Micromonospora tarapacensis]MBX7269782.1 SDR family NAD(P)-dependent oxidoreductase [Micromonospora tarapacensis]